MSMGSYIQHPTRRNLKPADLLFYSSDGDETDHVSMYYGAGKIIESTRGVGGNGPQINPLRGTEIGGRRIIAAEHGARIDKPTITLAGEKTREWIFSDSQLKDVVAGAGGPNIQVVIDKPTFLGRPTKDEIDRLTGMVAESLGERLVGYVRGR